MSNPYGFQGKHTKSAKQKMSASAKARFKTKHYWWTNGIDNKFCPECPGEGWQRGHNFQYTEEQKRSASERMKGNKFAVASWNWWKQG